MVRFAALTFAAGAALLAAAPVPAVAAAGAERDLPYIVPIAAGSTDSPAAPSLASSSLAAPSPRQALPPLSVQDGAGQPVALDQFRGRVVVLNFWATWCAPCVKEMGSLDRLQGALAGQPLSVVAASEDRGGAAAAQAYFTRQNYAFLKPFADPGMGVSQRLGVRGLPTTLLIDKQGRLVETLEGPYEWDGPPMLARLKALAAE